MKLQSLDDVILHELKDIYSAERQITKALPKMIKGVSSTQLQEGFKKHLKETEGQIKRLEKVGKILNVSLGGVLCKGMEGLLMEGDEVLKEDKNFSLDCALIAAAQRVEHYEIAAYGSAIAHVKQLDSKSEILKLLLETLREEEATDKKLTEIAETEVNQKSQAQE